MCTEFRVWAEVNLDAVRHNVTEIKKCLRNGVKLLGVVKADAYGHGVNEVAKTVLENGADMLAVAFCDEAVELRLCGFNVPILILGNSQLADIERIVEYDICPAVSEYDFAEKLSKIAVKKQKTLKIHIKVDTGMSRIGFLADTEENRKDSCKEIARISKLPNIVIEGMFTHFASADEENEDYTYMQYERFVSVAEELEGMGLKIPLKHACNSAGLVKFPDMQLDMVRAGIILYGMYPSREFDRNLINLVPAMTLKSSVTQIKESEKGTCLSYGMTHTLAEKSKIATLAVGYADGYPRSLSNRAVVLVNGKTVKQVGRICMDQCMIDVTEVNNINVGDEVTLFGDAGSEGVSVDNIAELLGTINYEITCGISRRVPRVYIKNGKRVKVINHIMKEYGL